MSANDLAARGFEDGRAILGQFSHTRLDISNWSDANVRRAHESIDSLATIIQRQIGFSNIISPLANIHPTAIIGSGVVIGARSTIGPYSYLRRNVVIGEDVEIGYGVELDNVVLHNETRIMHQSCIGRSVVGSGCNLAYGFVVATHRLDRQPIRVLQGDGSYFMSPARHHGAVIGAGVQAAVNVVLMPGTSVPPETLLYSGRQLFERSTS